MKPKTAKDFDVDENSSEITYNTLGYANYLISTQDGEPTDDEIRKAASVFIKGALLALYEPYGVVLMLTGNDNQKVQRMLHENESIAVSLFLEHYKWFRKKSAPIDQTFSELTLEEATCLDNE